MSVFLTRVRPVRAGLPVWMAALLLAALLVPAAGVAPAAADPPVVAATTSPAGTSSGDEFWLAFPQSLMAGDPPELSLFVAGAQAGTGEVHIPGLDFEDDFAVTPGEVTTVGVPIEAMLTGVDGTHDLAIHVTADVAVSVYGLNQLPFSTDAYLALPVHALGTDHVVTTWQTYLDARSQIAVVAAYDDTTVTITPAGHTATRPAGVPFTVTLDRGQAYQLQAPQHTSSDLTGTEVVADQPVAVYGGHECANVPVGYGYCDTIIQQTPPTSAWGSSYVTVPFIDREADTFRIVAAEDGTNVHIDGTEVATLDRGGFHEVALGDPAHITASRPVSVSQFMHGSTYEAGGADTEDRFGDPAIVTLPPNEQFLASYTVTTPATGFEDHTINLTVPTAAAGTVTIDGDPVPADAYEPIGASGFSGAQVPVPAGSKVLAAPVPFGAVMYGTNQDDSYAYVGGMSLSPVGLVDEVELLVGDPVADVGDEVCIPAAVRDADGGPLPGIRVDFEVTGEHELLGFDFTGPDGQASLCYIGEDEGEDTITATVGPHVATSTLTWQVPQLPLDPDGLVQSFWIFGPLFAIDADGTERDVLGDLLDALADDLGDPVQLFDDLDFREAPALAPVLVDGNGSPRTDVDVRAGVLSGPGAPSGGAVMVIATPRAGGGTQGTRGRHVVRAGDTVQLNLSSIGASLPPGSSIVGVPAYGETDQLPGAPAPTEDVDPIATMEERFAEDPSTGEIAATLAAVTDADGVPTPAAIPGVVGTVAGDAEAGTLVADLPAIDRMLAHFQNFSIEQEVGMSAALAYFPAPLGILVSAFTVISTGFILLDAMQEFTDYLNHMTDGGTAESFVPRGAASHGDPHLRTHDGAQYSIQSVGELVLARTEGLEVQTRTKPVLDLPAVALNAVVAVAVGDQVIEVRGDQTHLTVDGEVLTFEELSHQPLALDDGGSLWRGLGAVVIETGDGHRVLLRCGSGCGEFIDVWMTPAELGAGGFEGLFGDNDGDPDNDFQDRDGTVRARPDFEEMHGSYADEWRVTEDESLFTYGPGEDTETFTNRDFPYEEVTVDTLPADARAAAEAVCSAAGLGEHDPFTYDACVIDVAMTGDPCFARSAQWAGVVFPHIGTADDSGILPDPDENGENGEDDPDVPLDPDPVCTQAVFSDVPTTHTHFASICRVAGEGIALGFRDGTYGPSRAVTRGQLASFVARSLEVAGVDLPGPGPGGYHDTAGSGHRDAIDRLTAAGIVEGVVAGQEFRPAEPVTREQVASVLVRSVRFATDDPDLAASGGPHFTDTGRSVHAANVDLAAELGLTVGTRPGIFEPRGHASRGQTATFLSRLLDTLDEDG